MSTILFAGGGTLGPVTPLLAVLDRLREHDSSFTFAWAGTDHGPERDLIQAKGIPFITIPEAKLPRFLTPKLATLPFDLLRARKAASLALDAFRPRLVLSAGGFTAVPIVFEAGVRQITCIAHQLDAKPLLSNRLIAKFCRYVTTSFSYDRAPFGSKVVTYQVPTPVRSAFHELPSREVACRFFGLNPNQPVAFVTGGGTGSLHLNEAMVAISHMLPPNLQVIHSTGKGRGIKLVAERSGYVMTEFLSEGMVEAVAAADIIISRAGFGAMSEFAAASKAVIFIPLPNSPQEMNVAAIGDSAVILHERQHGWHKLLLDAIEDLLKRPEERARLGSALHETIPTDDGSVLANLVMSVLV